MTINFYDTRGEAYAYTDDNETIFTFSGKPIGFIDNDSIYSFLGKHIAFFENGNVWDYSGDKLLFTDDSSGGAMNPLKALMPLKGLKLLKPIKGLKEIKPLKSIKSLGWSKLQPNNIFGI